MVAYRHCSVSLWRDPDSVPHCRILSPDKTEWRFISATPCGWRRCFVSDQLWFMTRIREEEEAGIGEQNLNSIQRVQSKAARIVYNAGCHSPSSDLLHSLLWLPVRHRIEFKAASLCFKAVKLGTPYLNNTKVVHTTASSALIQRGFVNCSSCWHFTWSSSLFCSWTMSLESVTTWAASIQYTLSCFKSKLEFKTYYFRRHMDIGQLAP